jgi:trehalose 6-phosphate phosphatase
MTSETFPGPNANWALFLDVDGTLLDIASDPASVEVPPGLLTTLSLLRETLGGALALVSGRAIADLDRLFFPLELAAAGQHGAEMRLAPGGKVETLVNDEPIRLVEGPIEDYVRLWPGVLLERKGLSLAVHYRHAPESRAMLRQYLVDTLRYHKSSLTMLEGRMVFDLKSPGVTKGTAIARLMLTEAFRRRVPVFIGDDRTDEYGFATVNQAGGYTIRVGTLDGSVARSQISDPAAVRAWLDHVIGSINADARDGRNRGAVG